MGAKKRYKIYKYRILIIILLFVISIISFDYIIDQVRKEEIRQETELKDRDFDVIWDYLRSWEDLANSDAQGLAYNIEENIKNTMDLDQLEEDLKAGNRESLIDLVDQTINDYDFTTLVKNNRNSCIVLEGYDKILADRMVDLSKVEAGKIHSNFSDYFDISYNKKLFKTAERLIQNHTSTNPIAVEIYDYTDNPDHILINSCTYENLKKVYITEGVKGLRNYEFLVPAYITRDGDIFGNLDIKEGNPNANSHKFVVIMSFNLYDQIMQIRPDFEQNSFYSYILYGFDNILTAIYLVASITCIVLFIISIFYIKSYNVAIIEYLGQRSLSEEDEDI